MAVEGAERVVHDAKERLAEAEAAAEAAGQWEPLLYADGDELEVVAEAALRELGGRTALPSEGGIEDLRLETPGGTRYVVEIKGSTGGLKLDNLRQVVDWRTAAIAHGADAGTRALVIANPFRLVAPEARLVSECFHPNVLGRAEALAVVVLSGRQLYEAIRGVQSGESPEDRLWVTIEGTPYGLVDLPEFAPHNAD
jgi:hypothetical protein